MLNGLVLTLGTVFSIILLGYALRISGNLSGDHAAGIGKLTTKILLPSTLFLSMATIDFHSVRWLFIVGVGLARSLVAFIVLGITYFTTRNHSKTALTEGAMRAMFATQSNDFALGLPVLSSLFPDTVVQYIFLIAPVQLILINPILYLIIEWGLVKAAISDSDKINIGKLVFRVFKNPTVYMTMLGLVANFAFKSDPPLFFYELLGTLGRAFTAGALVALGCSIAGKLKGMRGKSLLRSFLMIGAKTLLLPVVSTVILSSMNVGTEELPNRAKPGRPIEEVDLALVGFIMGTIPVSPVLFLTAADVGLLVTEFSQAVVLCTLVSAPLMMITAQLAFLTLEGSGSLAELLQSTSAHLGICSIVGSLVVLAIRLGSPLGRTLSTFNVLFLCGAQLAFSIGVQTCYIPAHQTASVIRYLFIWTALYCVRVTVVLSSLGLAVTHAYGLAVNKKQQWTRIFLGGLTVAIQMTVRALTLKNPEGGYNKEVCWVSYEASPARNAADVIQNAIFLAVLTWCSLKLNGPAHQSRIAPLTAVADASVTIPGAEGTEAVQKPTAVGESLEAAAEAGNNTGNCSPSAAREISAPSFSLNGVTSDATSTDDEPDSPESPRPVLDPVTQAWAKTMAERHEEEDLQLAAVQAADATVVGPADADEEECSDEEGDEDELALLSNTASPSSIGAAIVLSTAAAAPAATAASAAPVSATDAAALHLQPQPADAALTVPAITYRDQLFIIIQALTEILHCTLAFWLLVAPTRNGIFAQVAFLDVFCASFQGLLTFFVFGTKYRFIRPVVKRLGRLKSKLKRMIFSGDGATLKNKRISLSDLDPAVREAVQKFEPHQPTFETIFVRNRRHKLQRYTKVFTGTDLITFLVARGLAGDRLDATVMGKHFLTAGRIVHVHNKHHFEDRRYFYRFVRPRQESSSEA